MPETVSIVIPTFNRASLLPRAIDTALGQSVECEVIVADHGSSDDTPEVAARYGDRISYVRRDRDFGPHYCWLDGVMHSSGDLVHLQYDDDWLEPTFIERCRSVMDAETGFAFSAVKIHVEGGEESVVFDDWASATGTYPVKQFEKRVRKTVISPGCCLFRRQTLIDSLYQGQLPLPMHHYHGVGPDIFASLLSMLRYPKIGYVKDPLAVFLSHDGSITIDAAADADKARAIKAAYDETRLFYKELKTIKKWRALKGIR